MKHLWEKLTLKPKEWKRTCKAMHVMDYLVKNGAPRVIQDIKDDLYKIRAFSDFKFMEGSVEQGAELRDKVKGLVELVNDANKLQYEREFAKQTREKFMGISSTGSQAEGMVGAQSNPAAPASGNKYGGFGSEDIARFGYNNDQQFGTQGAYDPYTKTQSTTTQPTTGKPKEAAQKKKVESDSDDDSSVDSDSDDSEAQRKKAKRAKKKAQKAEQEKKQNEEQKVHEVGAVGAVGLGQAPKAGRTLAGNQPAPLQTTPQ